MDTKSFDPKNDLKNKPNNPMDSNTPQPARKETVVKTKSTTRARILIGVFVAVAVAVIGAITYFGFWVSEETLKPVKFNDIDLFDLFHYIDKEKDWHNSFVKYSFRSPTVQPAQDYMTAQEFDIKSSAGDVTYYQFPGGLILNTKTYADLINGENGKAATFNEATKLAMPPAQWGVKSKACLAMSDNTKEKKIIDADNAAITNPVTIDLSKYDQLLNKQYDDTNKVTTPLIIDKPAFPKAYHLSVKIDNAAIADEEMPYIFWQSSDPTVVLVYPDGKLFPISEGEAEVRAVVCGKEIGTVTVTVPQTAVFEMKIETFNPNGKLDTKFLTGVAISKKNLLEGVTIPSGKNINKVSFTPKMASMYGADINDIINEIMENEGPDKITVSGGNPIQGTIRFFLSNDGGENWVEADKKVDSLATITDLPEMTFEFSDKGTNDLRLAVLFQSDFDQTFFGASVDNKIISKLPYAGAALTTSQNIGGFPESTFHFQQLTKTGTSASMPIVLLPGPSPVLTGFDFKATVAKYSEGGYFTKYESPKIAPEQEKIKLIDINPESPIPTPETSPIITAPITTPTTTEPATTPTVAQPLVQDAQIIFRGHNRVIIKWSVNSEYANIKPEEMTFKFGTSADDLKLGATVYKDANDTNHPYYAVLRGLNGGETFDKNDEGYAKGRYPYYFRIAKGDVTYDNNFKTLNRLQTIIYYYRLALNRDYLPGDEKYENPDNIKDLEEGGILHWYKPGNQTPLELAGIKFTMINDRLYQQFEEILKNLSKDEALKFLYRAIHDRIYDNDLAKYYDDEGLAYWKKVAGGSVHDVVGIKLYMLLSQEYRENFLASWGVSEEGVTDPAKVANAKANLAYQIVLKRGADKDGADFLVKNFANAKDMRKHLLDSKEAKNRLAKIEKDRGREEAIRELYEVCYARPADLGGLKHWNASKMTVEELMKKKFLDSKEFKNVIKD